MLEWILLACMAAGVACAAVLIVPLLALHVFVKYFRRVAHKLRRRGRKAVSMKVGRKIREELGQGNVTHIGGILDEEAGEFEDLQPIAADEVDDEMRNAHRNGRVVVWS
ncbi:hypothetical protein ACFCX4_26405 [Kitasatospora sp. NPDC056327]|uniref:hypothetical protein n=1 Tax=Kitasatospora sp. NPDC056327 TaxID=3345785 RepID=UPI0035E18E6D